MVEKSGSLRLMGKKRFQSTSPLLIYIIISLFLALFTSCISRTAFLKESWDKNPCVNISYWGKDWKKVPFQKRVQQAPAELIEKIRIENELHGFQERPSPVVPPLEFFEAMDSIEASMPENLKALLRESFIGLFAVKSLGGTGYADVVCDGAGNENYGLIVLDAEALMGKKANEWATWKENSIFRPSSHGRVKLKAIIEEEENNTAANAVRFILLHEMGHALGVLTRAHASWIERWFKNPDHLQSQSPAQ